MPEPSPDIMHIIRHCLWSEVVGADNQIRPRYVCHKDKIARPCLLFHGQTECKAREEFPSNYDH